MSTITKRLGCIAGCGAAGLLLSVFITACLMLTVLVWANNQASIREIKDRHETAPAGGQFVQASDVEIFVQELGPADGPPLLFIHGTAAWSEIWRETMTAVAADGYRAIAIDLPPFGYSERPATADYTRQAQARRIIAVLDALDLPQTTLVGHSFGGGATVEAAMLAPERTRALVLVDVALGLPNPGDQMQNNANLQSRLLGIDPLRNGLVALTLTNPRFTKPALQSLILDPADATDSVVTMLQQPFALENSTPAYGDWLPELLNAPTPSLSTDTAAYSTLNMPVLIVWGDSDTVVPLSEGEMLHSLIPASELEILPLVNHVPHIEDVTAFNEALLRFLSKHL